MKSFQPPPGTPSTVRVSTGVLPCQEPVEPLGWRETIEIRHVDIRRDVAGIQMAIAVGRVGEVKKIVAAAEGPETPEGLAYILRGLADCLVASTGRKR